jgi:hypothetical protein
MRVGIKITVSMILSMGEPLKKMDRHNRINSRPVLIAKGINNACRILKILLDMNEPAMVCP